MQVRGLWYLRLQVSKGNVAYIQDAHAELLLFQETRWKSKTWSKLWVSTGVSVPPRTKGNKHEEDDRRCREIRGWLRRLFWTYVTFTLVDYWRYRRGVSGSPCRRIVSFQVRCRRSPRLLPESRITIQWARAFWVARKQQDRDSITETKQRTRSKSRSGKRITKKIS